ncbi:MAG TPA: hypothetical protein VFV23_10895 [Verrucomicrobiae bacterium]|nr:hypothetical protein [Verrucomicrobiae bacterium]
MPALKSQTRIFIALAALIALIPLFYTEEDWRGKRDWENCKREIEAKGETMDWDKLIPPRVPEEKNFFAAPKMQEWFVRSSSWPQPTNELTGLSTNDLTVTIITNKTDALNYLSWSDQFTPDFNLIRDALKRPYARIDGDYSDVLEIPFPNFVSTRAVAQVLAQRAKCHLILNEPQKALDELTFLHDLRLLFEGAPTHQPVEIVTAMIDEAVAQLYAKSVSEGLQSHIWKKQQLAILQKQLNERNVFGFIAESFREKPARSNRFFEQLEHGNKIDRAHSKKIFGIPISWMRHPTSPYALLFNAYPRGWILQNYVVEIEAEQKIIDAMDNTNMIVSVDKIDREQGNIEAIARSRSPFALLSGISIPNYSKALQSAAYIQNYINETEIACALERYKLANGDYPKTLDALVPQFMDKVPHDIIGGQPLKYRRTDDGKFLLYSVGWNETDDGGLDLQHGNGSINYTNGDWVWKN